MHIRRTYGDCTVSLVGWGRPICDLNPFIPKNMNQHGFHFFLRKPLRKVAATSFLHKYNRTKPFISPKPQILQTNQTMHEIKLEKLENENWVSTKVSPSISGGYHLEVQSSSNLNQSDRNVEPVCSLRGHGRAILTNEQAQAIFRNKPTPNSKERDKAGALARMFGVSVKTVRDIWIGRTWYRATYHLDESKPPAIERLVKKAGRPKGVKDSKPRIKKIYPSDRDAAENVADKCVHLEFRKIVPPFKTEPALGEMHVGQKERQITPIEPAGSVCSALCWPATPLQKSEVVAQADNCFAAWLASPIKEDGFADPFRDDWNF